MSVKDVKQVLHRSRTSDSIVVDNGIKPPNTNQKQQIRMRKSTSLDSGEKDEVKNSTSDPTGPFQRRTFTVVRRRTSKRKSKPEPEFGHDTEAYEKIRERVLQERAVTNAIDALQERWRMIMLMYGDCVDLNHKRMERKLRKLCRRSSKRSNRPEPEFGHDVDTYKKIRERVVQERAVTNAVDALQERWRMIMFMYEDCVDLIKQRAECKLKKLCIKR